MSPQITPGVARLPVPAARPQIDNGAEVSLIERVCSGDKQAFYDLIKPYERAVYVSAFSILQNEADAEVDLSTPWLLVK